MWLVVLLELGYINELIWWELVWIKALCYCCNSFLLTNKIACMRTLLQHWYQCLVEKRWRILVMDWGWEEDSTTSNLDLFKIKDKDTEVTNFCLHKEKISFLTVEHFMNQFINFFSILILIELLIRIIDIFSLLIFLYLQLIVSKSVIKLVNLKNHYRSFKYASFLRY